MAGGVIGAFAVHVCFSQVLLNLLTTTSIHSKYCLCQRHTHCGTGAAAPVQCAVLLHKNIAAAIVTMAAHAMAPATENFAYTLAATEVIQQIKAGKLTVKQYAEALFQRCSVRDGDVKAWATPLDYERIMKKATALDALPKNQRGPLHGLIVAVKDVIYTEGAVYWLIVYERPQTAT